MRAPGPGWLALLALACATPQSADLDRAEARYRAAAENPEVDPDDSVDMYEARRQLDRAHELLGRAGPEVVSHHAYLAELHVQIAELDADTRETRADLEAQLARREQMRLEARTSEADLASARAREAEARARSAEAAAREAAERRAVLEAQVQELHARQTERGMLLTLGGVDFEPGSAALRPEGAVRVDRVAGFLIANPGRELVVEGHADDAGDAAAALALSRARAEAVRDRLVASGIAAGRIAAAGLGRGADAAGEGRGRVELVILGPGESAQSALRTR